MARATFGGGTNDWTSQLVGGGIPRAIAGTVTFWTARVGGTRHTDLLLNGSPVTSITTGNDGQIPEFQGPDGVLVMWADAGGGRVKIDSPLTDPSFLSPTIADSVTGTSGSGLTPQQAVDRRASTAVAASKAKGFQSLMPPGVKFRGINLVPSWAAVGAAANSAASWEAFYQTWPWATIKTQIDMAASLGANGVRVIGGLGAIGTGAGQISLATYVARYEQIVSYCQSKGMYVSACLDDYLHRVAVDQVTTGPQANTIAQATALLAMLGRYANVVCVDISNELLGAYTTIKGGSLSGNVSTVAALMADLYNALKPLTSLPLGFSHSYDLTITSWYTAFMPYCDYIDLHVYDYSTGRLALYGLIDNLLANFPGKPVLFGEFGNELNPAGGSYNGDYINQIKSVRDLANRPGFDGACFFSIVDAVDGGHGGTHWTGLYDTETGTPRTAVVTAFKALPTRSGVGVVSALLARSVSVTTTNASTTVTVPTGNQFAAAFTTDDVGRTISGTGIPGGTTIASVATDGRSVTLSAAATASGTVTGTVGGDVAINSGTAKVVGIATVYFPVPCRVKVTINLDLDAKVSTDTYIGFPTLDNSVPTRGGALEGDTLLISTGAVIRATRSRSWTFVVEPGTHTFRAYAQRSNAGGGTTSVVVASAGGPTTTMDLEVSAA